MLTMKTAKTVYIILYLTNTSQGRLFGKRGKRPANKRPNIGGPDDHNIGQRLDQSPVPDGGNHASKIGSVEDELSEIDQISFMPELQRKANRVRVTLTDIDVDVKSFSAVETIFFEDTFMSAFLQMKNSNNGKDDDIHVRSMVVVEESSSDVTRDRSLFRTPGKYFDIAALFEWSCRFCGISSTRASTAMDDDYTDDDFYFNGVADTPSPTASPTSGPSSTPTVGPTAIPTYHWWLDDDITDDDFYFNGPDAGSGPTLDDDITDDTFYFSGTLHDEGDDGNLGSITRDDDVYSFFFGQRVLEESDERHLEDLLCQKLRAGPFPAFHKVQGCSVLFSG